MRCDARAAARASSCCRGSTSASSPATRPTPSARSSSKPPGFRNGDPAYFDALWTGVVAEFDSLTAALPLTDRRVAELSPIERALLAMGAWELEHRPEIPYRVVINEAVELAKSYGGTDGHQFVNGVLDKLAASRARERDRRREARGRRGLTPATRAVRRDAGARPAQRTASPIIPA